MRLSLKNLGKVAEADIELNGITVIAGENDTGKSTISRALFCAFNSLYQKDQKIFRERKKSIEGQLMYLFGEMSLEENEESSLPQKQKESKNFKKKINEFIEELLENREQYINKNKDFRKYLEDFYLSNRVKSKDQRKEKEKMPEKILKSLLDFVSDKIFSSISVSDKEISTTLSQRIFDSLFSNQINNIDHPQKKAEINLFIKDNKINFLFDNNGLNRIENIFILDTEAIYIDDPFVLDTLNSSLLYYLESHPEYYKHSLYPIHRIHLKRKLNHKNEKHIVDEIITKKKLSDIIENISSVCIGEMIRSKNNEFIYKRKNSDATLNINNISAGLKTFVILQTLLLNGSLEENGTLILDEPEIHLHPAWQIIFAELIVLIQKEFGMHILLNTHSPYFLNAIEIYTEIHEIDNKCKYYLAENSDRGAIFTDVSNEVNKIYKKLAKPFKDLESMEFLDE